MAEQAPLKYTVTHYRQKEHTHEEFMRWITEVHLPLAIPIFKKHGVIEYSIFTTPAALNESLKAKFSVHRPTWDFADFDCFLEYTIPSMDVIANVMTDPDWPAAIKDDEKWIDTSRALLSVGHVTTYLKRDGEVLNVPE